MGGNTEYIAGHGHLSLAQAVKIAQNSESPIDQNLASYLERKLDEVWTRLNQNASTYIFPSDEFALFNYYKSRFGDQDIVRDATARYWNNHRA